MDYFQEASLQPASKALYNNRLRILRILIPHEFHEAFHDIKGTIERIRSYLIKNNSYSSQSLNSFIKSLMAYRKYHMDEFPNSEASHEIWNRLLKGTNEEANAYREQNEPSPTQQQKQGIHLPLSTIQKAMKDLTEDDPVKLLISMYVMIPPMRADYGDLEIVEQGERPTKPNFLLLTPQGKMILSISDYKVARTHGTINQVLPEPLTALVEQSLRIHPRSYLFTKKDGSPYTRREFSLWANTQLTRLFRVKFTLTMFRHIFISSLPRETMTSAELTRIARLMGHSTIQQDLYRWV